MKLLSDGMTISSVYTLLLSLPLSLWTLSPCTASQSPSKLLSNALNQTLSLPELDIDEVPPINVPTQYFETFHYDLDIPIDDDIDTIHIFPDGMTITTVDNTSIFTISFPDNITADTVPTDDDITLNYHDLTDWSSIHEEYDVDTIAIRRRLYGWNSRQRPKYKGRYVADGITRKFKDAQGTCRHLYGELASIMSVQEEEQVKTLCAKWNLGNCWIGYKRPWSHWEDGRRPTYLHWLPGEPNNYGGNENCAELKYSGQWNDVKCKEQRIGICERPRIHVVGHYIAVMRALNWKDANKRCQELFSTDLATIENARENIMVRRACSAFNPEAHCWIGLKRPFRTWNDGEDAKITNWADGEPNNAGGREDCTAIKPSQRWNDADCRQTKYFVCNTISQKTRARKRAEAQRKRQEREAKLEKQRRKIEDQIIKQYMSTHGNAMFGSGKGGMFGPSGVRTMGRMMGMQGMSQVQPGYNKGMMGGHMMYPGMNGARQGMMGGQMTGGGMRGMNKFGMNQRMMQQTMNRNPFGRSGVPGMSTPLKPIPKGVDGGHIGNLHPNQLHGIYGSLGNPPATPARKAGEPLKIQLVSPNAGGAAGATPSTGTHQGTNPSASNILSAIRRRLVDGEEGGDKQEALHSVAGNMVSDHDQKCKVLKSYELCIGHDFVEIRTLKSNQDKEPLDEFAKFQNLVMNEFHGNQDEIQYIASQQFVYDQDGGESQCFVYHETMTFCMSMDAEKGEMEITMDDGEEKTFSVDGDWDEIESVRDVMEHVNGGMRSDVMNKCARSGDAKICIQQMVNEEYEVMLYTANVHYLTASVGKEAMMGDVDWSGMEEQDLSNGTWIEH